MPISQGTRALLVEKVGPGTATQDAPLDRVLVNVPKSAVGGWPEVSLDPLDRLLHARGQSLPDWVALRSGRIGRFPDAVAYPECSEQLRGIIERANRDGTTLIPFGGGTSVVGHVTPSPEGPPVITVDLRRMSAFKGMVEETCLATFGAGVAGPDAEAVLRSRGFTLGHFPQSFEFSTLGGWVATRSSGQESLGYGRIEQLFAGGHIESPSGPLDLPSFPASAAGPDLREIILGSEGRLGVLTEATVRVARIPETEEAHGVFLPDWESAVNAVRTIAQTDLNPSMLRLSSRAETQSLLALSEQRGLAQLVEPYLALRGLGEGRTFLLVGLSGNRSSVRATRVALLAKTRTFGGVHVGQGPGRSWRHSRFMAPYLRNTLWEMGYAVDTVETACAWNLVTGLVQGLEGAIRQSFENVGERCHVYTHLSRPYAHGTSVYTTLVFRVARDPDETLRRWRCAKDAASQAIVSLGGTISHQHGVGTDHLPYVAREKGSLGIQALRALVRIFDPKGIMNPGKLIP